VIALVRRFLALGPQTIARVRWHRALGRIDRQLGRGDPHLRTMFAIFAGLAGDERPTGPEPLPHRHGFWRRPVALGLLMPLLAAGLIVGLVGALAPAQASASFISRPPPCHGRTLAGAHVPVRAGCP